MKINLVHATSDVIVKNLAAGLVDLGIVCDPPSSPDLVLNKLGDKKFGFWSRADDESFSTVNEKLTARFPSSCVPGRRKGLGVKN